MRTMIHKLKKKQDEDETTNASQNDKQNGVQGTTSTGKVKTNE